MTSISYFCDITSSVLDTEHIETLKLRHYYSRTSYLYNRYKSLNIYKVVPEGVLCQINNDKCILMSQSWKTFPPSQNELFDCVNTWCTVTGKGHTVINFPVEYYPKVKEYFENTGFKYSTLYIADTPTNDKILIVAVGEKTAIAMADTGVFVSKFTGKYENLLKLHASILELSGYNCEVKPNSECLFLVTPYWKFSRKDVIKLHYKLLQKIVSGDIPCSVSYFLRSPPDYIGKMPEYIPKIAEANCASFRTSKDILENYLKWGLWQGVLELNSYGLNMDIK
jgi:hypothetical protein